MERSVTGMSSNDFPSDSDLLLIPCCSDGTFRGTSGSADLREEDLAFRFLDLFGGG